MTDLTVNHATGFTEWRISKEEDEKLFEILAEALTEIEPILRDDFGAYVEREDEQVVLALPPQTSLNVVVSYVDEAVDRVIENRHQRRMSKFDKALTVFLAVMLGIDSAWFLWKLFSGDYTNAVIMGLATIVVGLALYDRIRSKR